MIQNLSGIMNQIQGLEFKVIGPFLVTDLNSKTKKFFENLAAGEHGMEKILNGQKTESHTHDFCSFYKSNNLNVDCAGEEFILPSRALTLVLPGVEHSWIPKSNQGSVGSIDWRHAKQILVTA